MSDIFCPDCVANQDQLGFPSHARWVGPDGANYCSMHFRNRFGFCETMVKIENYEPPKTTKKPQVKKKEKQEVEA